MGSISVIRKRYLIFIVQAGANSTMGIRVTKFGSINKKKLSFANIFINHHKIIAISHNFLFSFIIQH